MRFLSNIITFLKESRLETGKVNWPSREQTIKNTLAVIAFSAAVAVILGLFDLLLNTGLTRFLLLK